MHIGLAKESAITERDQMDAHAAERKRAVAEDACQSDGENVRPMSPQQHQQSQANRALTSIIITLGKEADAIGCDDTLVDA